MSVSCFCAAKGVPSQVTLYDHKLDLDVLFSLYLWSNMSVLHVNKPYYVKYGVSKKVKHTEIPLSFLLQDNKVFNSACPRSVMRNGFRKQYPEKLFHHPLLHLC